MKSLSILLIDDDEIERIKFKKVSRETKFIGTVMEANNGAIAITLLENKNYSFNLIITDINMPKMNGFEFLKELRNNRSFKKIPVVIMSSSNDLKDLKKCYEYGISGYFIKPLQFADYISKVASLLGYWQNSEAVC